MKQDLASSVVRWFRRNGRQLPWRNTRDPYRIWVSEMMCQQTSVQTVIPYYHRFLQRFPDIEALAQANEVEVLSLWEGLGYYRRARNMKRAAEIVCKELQGQFPRTKQELLALPGIGEYSAGAILAIAHGVAAPALDGNLIRIYSRFYGISDPVDRPETLKKLWDIARRHVPPEKKALRDFTEGMMDLGAGVCKPRQADCYHCPLARGCAAKKFKKPSVLPRKEKRQTREKFYEIIYLNKNEKEIALAKKGLDPKYPQFNRLPFHLVAYPPKKKYLREFKYAVTYRDFIVYLVDKKIPVRLKKNTEWIPIKKLDQVLLPAIDRRIVKEML